MTHQKLIVAFHKFERQFSQANAEISVHMLLNMLIPAEMHQNLQVLEACAVRINEDDFVHILHEHSGMVTTHTLTPLCCALWFPRTCSPRTVALLHS